MHYLVVGFGVSGKAVVKFLLSQHQQISVYDDKVIGFSDISAITNYYNNLDRVPDEIDEIIVSPGINVNKMKWLCETDKNIIGELSLFKRYIDKPLIAITGTNGKSTVTTLLGMIAEHAQSDYVVGGNLGVPALELAQLQPAPAGYVLEVSSFQLERCADLSAKVAVILNIDADHLDRHYTMQEYIKCKLNIYNNAQNLVFPIAQPQLWPQAVKIDTQAANGYVCIKNTEISYFYIKTIDDKKWLCHDERLLICCEQLPLKGGHNQDNYLAVLAASYAAGWSYTYAWQAIEEFTGLKHRFNIISKARGVTWVNDSKATNLHACCAAIDSLVAIISGKIILIIGGVSKQNDFSPLFDRLKSCVRAVFLFGRDKFILQQQLQAAVPCYLWDKFIVMPDLLTVVQDGDGVLFAPACASFDMFANFEQRGDTFTQLVLQGLADAATSS